MNKFVLLFLCLFSCIGLYAQKQYVTLSTDVYESFLCAYSGYTRGNLNGEISDYFIKKVNELKSQYSEIYIDDSRNDISKRYVYIECIVMADLIN